MTRLIFGLAAVAVCGFGQAKADIVFSDDFNDGNADGWVFLYNSGMTQYPGGDWSVENGTLVQHFFGDGNAGLVDNLFISDQVIEAQVRTGGYAGVVLWYDQVVDGEWANFVAVNHNYQGGLRVHEFIDGNGYRTDYSSPWIANDTWFDLRVEADSATGSLTVYLDDTYIFTHLASTSQRTGLSGVYSGNEVGYFDNFRLTSDVPVPEPSPAIFFSLLAVGVLALEQYRWRRV